MSTFSYPEVGATRDGALPPGYRHLRYRTRLRSDSFRAAGEAVLTWRLHRRVGIPFQTVADRAAPGVRVASGLAWLSAPCEIVWTVDDDGRIGFGYGTLAGHPVAGEESFVVSRDEAGEVWFTLTSFSRPARWYTKVAGPLVPVLQRAYARRCGSVLKRLA
ncbi:MAG TPA: DUF1990 domain-containing protein [Natronosporangium sp.]